MDAAVRNLANNNTIMSHGEFLRGLSLSPGMSPMAFWGSDGVTLCECENFFSSLVSFFNGWIDRKNGASRGRERCEKWDPLKTLKEKHQLRSIGRKK